MENIKTISFSIFKWTFFFHLVAVGWTTQFSHQFLPISKSFTLSTVITSEEVFVTFSNESKTSVDFLSLNESINNPDLSFISASISMRYLKNTWSKLCANESRDNPITKLVVQLATFEEINDVRSRGLQDGHIEHEVVGQVGLNCTNILDPTCDAYGDLSSDAINEANHRLNPLRVVISLDFSCTREANGSQLQIDVSPVLHQWLQELETCRTSQMNGEKDAANLERFIFRIFAPSDQLDQKQVKRNEPTLPGLESDKESQLSLSLTYFIDQRCRVSYTILKEETQSCETGEECLSYETRNVCRLRSYCSFPECRVGCDFEDNDGCAWSWRKPKDAADTGFRVTSVAQALYKIQQLKEEFSAPVIDANNKTDGNFLLLAWEKDAKTQQQYRLTSPVFSDSQSTCNLQAKIHMNNMENVALKMVIESLNRSSYVPMAILGNRRNTWENLKHMVGKRVEPFEIILEVENPAGVPSHFAIDDLRLVDCFPNKVCALPCVDKEFKCNDGSCINRNQICDLNKDCLNGEDESHPNCEKLPENSTCTFEEGWCGWTPVSLHNITWERTRRSYYTDTSGPQFDHTYKNNSGHFLLVNMKKKSVISNQAVLRSPIFAIPPTYNQNRTSKFFESCQLRFFYHMHGGHVSTLDALVVLQNPRNPRIKPVRFCERSGNQGNMWHRAVCPLPSIKGSRKYYIQITATRGLRGHAADIGIDDISLSPECFGQGVPASEIVGYNYYEILNSSDGTAGNATAYKLTTCNNTGRLGPSGEQCRIAYDGTGLSSMVSMDSSRDGVQVWTVPESKSYTLIAKGASGGRGALVNQMTSHGSIVRVTQYLRKGEHIHVLVGQEGTSLCDQANGYSADREQICRSELGSSLSLLRNSPLRKNARQAPSFPTSKPRPQEDPLKALGNINRLYGGGGGGGGGATFVYRIVDGAISLLLVAAGGGGLGYNASTNIYPNGRSLNVSLEPHSGSTQPWGAGGGGGYQGSPVKNNNSATVSISTTRFQKGPEFQNTSTMLVSAGLSLIDGGGVGGEPCSPAATWGAAGGFGGGGGGCTSGGGGGGHVGGNAHVSLSSNGEGGWSFIGKGGMYPAVDAGGHVGPGEFVAIPSFPGCGCEHSCVLLDDFEPHTGCVCPENWVISEDGISCEGRDFPGAYLIAIIILCVIIFCVVGIICFYLYNRYQRKKVNILRRKVMGPELQLSRLRAQSGPGGVLTEYNPNYEFGGETYTLTDLKEIPRENLRLVKALGQGAFGEVYQGFYRHRDGDAVEMPVAVKTLPELSSNQAEMDFLMEALIMSKFNHPNIVHFIGVCFDKHPRFIILELLAGGDLKTFLRESRPKPDKGTPLSMKDLLLCAMDVAKGCKYLEDNHFIHRDIAARNCLLTTKGPGRVVKIADFGMARDIYRADYYKKGGKAMLPVKWMPPEAFLDGIFTSKTDAWSYGVLLWEIFSLGYMPYPGRGNQDVMQLVTNGGRLEPPSNCPTPVYGMMSQCWHPIPEERPNFATIMERIGYCIQDPEVVNAPLPIFQRPPSSERDVTLMRPPNSDDSSCLRIIHGHHHRGRNPSPLSHNEPLSPNCSTGDYLVPLTPLSNPTTPPPPPEARGATASSRTGAVGGAGSEIMPESESTETILDEEDEGESTVQMSTKKGGSKRQNGIDSGITLKATALKEESSGSGSRHPAPYANVGSKKREANASDEEIRC